MATDVKYAIQIVDRWSQPLTRFESQVNRINCTTANHTAQISNSFNKATGAASGFDSAMAKAAPTAGMFGGAMKMIPAVAVGAAIVMAAGAVAQFGKESILASAQMETYATTLKVMLGSQGAARERMQEYSDIAAKTPFQLSEVVEAGNQLQAIGRYNRENLTNLGDLAAASGKPLEQVLSAYGKLATGQRGEAVNMFRDLLISTDDWVKATGKGIKSNGELIASTEEMIAALPAILKAKGFIGMMGEQSKTTAGQMSNLQDSAFQLKVAMGDQLKPAFNDVLKVSQDVIQSWTTMIEVPVELKIQKERAELNNLVESLIDANDNEDLRKRLIVEIQAKYPDFLKNIDAETVSTDDLRKRLVEVNAEYDKKAKKMLLQNRYDKLGADITSIDDKIDAINSVVVAWEGIAEAEKNLKQYVPVSGMDASGKSVNYRNQDGSLNFAAVNSFYESVKDSPENIDFVLAYNEYLAAAEMMSEANINNTNNNVFGTKDVQKLEAQKRILQEQQKKYYQKMLEDADSLLGSTGGGSGSGGGGGGNNNNNNTPTGNRLQKAEDDIAGGGRNMKVINITLDSLIANNTNVFEPGQDPAGASDFLDKLSRALTMVVNDVNYMP